MTATYAVLRDPGSRRRSRAGRARGRRARTGLLFEHVDHAERCTTHQFAHQQVLLVRVSRRRTWAPAPTFIALSILRVGERELGTRSCRRLPPPGEQTSSPWLYEALAVHRVLRDVARSARRACTAALHGSDPWTGLAVASSCSRSSASADLESWIVFTSLSGPGVVHGDRVAGTSCSARTRSPCR